MDFCNGYVLSKKNKSLPIRHGRELSAETGIQKAIPTSPVKRVCVIKPLVARVIQMLREIRINAQNATAHYRGDRPGLTCIPGWEWDANNAALTRVALGASSHLPLAGGGGGGAVSISLHLSSFQTVKAKLKVRADSFRLMAS